MRQCVRTRWNWSRACRRLLQWVWPAANRTWRKTDLRATNLVSCNFQTYALEAADAVGALYSTCSSSRGWDRGTAKAHAIKAARTKKRISITPPMADDEKFWIILPTFPWNKNWAAERWWVGGVGGRRWRGGQPQRRPHTLDEVSVVFIFAQRQSSAKQASPHPTYSTPEHNFSSIYILQWYRLKLVQISRIISEWKRRKFTSPGVRENHWK